MEKGKIKLFSAIFIIVTVIFFTIYTGIKEARSNRIILATTTSTYDSGLLDYLIPYFENETGITVEVIAVGTGQALELGVRGDADVLLVHAREAEDEFIREGHGVHRVCVMYNDFIIVGPSDDPAGIKNKSVTEAMILLNKSGAEGSIKFYSRGDDSGTNKREIKLWTSVGYIPNSHTDGWYYETGAGMGDTLVITSENGGYTLTDRGTWLSYRAALNLTVLVEGEPILLNPYGAIPVNREKHPNVNFEGARKFVGFLVSKKGQSLIGNFTVGGQILFKPLFGICDKITGCNTTEEEVEYWKQYNGGYTGA